MRQLLATVFRWADRRNDQSTLEWWAYFGSFGDDFFAPED